MKKLLLLIPLLILFSCSNQERKNIQHCYSGYKSAILNNDGEKALQHVDSNTIAYYEQILTEVKNAGLMKINKMQFFDKMNVLLIRHAVPHDFILTTNGRKMFKHAVDHGMIGKRSVKNIEIGEIEIEGNSAKAKMSTKNGNHNFKFTFHKKNNEWKIDLTSIFPHISNSFKRLAESKGMGENSFIMSLLKEQTGIKPTIEIWEPVR